MKNQKTQTPAALTSIETLDLGAVTGGCAACVGGGAGAQAQQQPQAGAGAGGMAGLGQIAGLIQQFAGGQK